MSDFSNSSPWSFSEIRHQSSFILDHHSSNLATDQPLWDPTPPQSFVTRFVAPSMTTNTENTNLPSSPSTDSVQGNGDSDNGVETGGSQDPTTRSMDCRASFVFGVIYRLLLHLACNPFCCSKVRALWLQILEGITDDDVWLWVDGDEEWLREKQNKLYRMQPWELSRSQWADAQSALRRRIAQQRYPTVTGSHGKRNERIRSATPKQRVCAIACLIASSSGVAELYASHGRTPPTFRTPEIASILNHTIGNYWGTFPPQTSAWENALVKSRTGAYALQRIVV
ncbi:hypothetical protein EDC04DRAFT_3142868, partial [Pisolithus marmoratus]